MSASVTAAQLFGRWQLVAFDMESRESGERKPAYGDKPTGMLAIFPDGKMMAIVTRSGMKPASNDAESADILRSLIAYAGPCRIEGDRWITSVEISWNPSWVGTEQVRDFTLEGDVLKVISSWYARAPEHGGDFRGVITWKRDA